MNLDSFIQYLGPKDLLNLGLLNHLCIPMRSQYIIILLEIYYSLKVSLGIKYLSPVISNVLWFSIEQSYGSNCMLVLNNLLYF